MASREDRTHYSGITDLQMKTSMRYRNLGLTRYQMQEALKIELNNLDLQIYPTPLLGQYMTQGQFLSGV